MRYAILTFALILLAPQGVFAHATPITYEPGAGVTELSVPLGVTIYFSERIEPEASSIKVIAEDGSDASSGRAVLDASDPRIYRVGMTERGEGVYTVLWQVVSVDDGHFTRGSYSFLVSQEGEAYEGGAESVQVTYTTRVSEALLHSLTLIGESLMIALIMLMAFVIRPFLRSLASDVRMRTEVALARMLGRLALLSGGFFVLGSSIYFIKKGIELAVVRGEPAFSGLIALAQSSGGAATLIKLVLGFAFVVLWYSSRRWMIGSARMTLSEYALAAILIALLYLQSKVSHAAASFFLPNASVTVTIFHLFFKELLVGGVMVLAGFWALTVRLGISQGAVRVLFRYDVLAAIAIGIGGSTGVYVTWLHLKRFESIASTEWGVRFMMLAIFGGLFFMCRLLNQWFLARGGRYLRMTLPIEIAFGVVVLFYSAYISITTPPFLVEQHSFKEEAVLQDSIVTLEQHPYESEMLRLSFTDKEGVPITVADVTVSLNNSEQGIESNVTSDSPRSKNSVVIAKTALSPHGAWTVDVNATRSEGYDLRAAFSLIYPDDVRATRYSDEVRRFDSFGKAMLVLAGVIMLVSFVLLVRAVVLLRRSSAVSETEIVHHSAMPAGVVGSVLGIALVLVALGITARSMTSTLEAKCLAGGFEWRQALPARDMAVVGKNSVLGCYMHDGHYHLADEAEFDYLLPDLTLPTDFE